MSGSLPTSLALTPRLARWVEFADGRIIIRTGKVELGQGIRTALGQIAADELVVPLELVEVASAGTTSAPDEGLTAGSLSVQVSGAAIRQACAEVREIARAEAASQFGVKAALVELAAGSFSAAGKSLDYWSLPMTRLLDRDASGAAHPLSPAARKHVGRDVPRTDLRAKLLGRPAFISDLRPEGLQFARVVRPRSRLATLVDVDESVLDGLAATLVRERDFVAVVSADEATAVAAAARIARAARWDETASLPEPEGLAEFLVASGTNVEQFAGDPALSPSGHTATYSRPYLAHAAMGPVTAVANWDGSRLLVWSHTQGINPLRDALAVALKLTVDQIEITHVDGPGSYGHNGADDVAFDAAFIALRRPGTPVMVQWSRADELRWSPLGPAMRATIAADLDGSRITAWRHDVWSNGHSSRPNASRPGFVSWTATGGPPVPVSADPPFASGGGSGRNEIGRAHV